MTYKEIVNRIQDVVDQHYMLAGFGYGDLSDLKVRFENSSGDDAVQADYPYLFLNPATHNRTGAAVTYNFNMIVMDMARGEVSDNPYDNILAIQSQCQQYIDDVIAQLWNGYTDPPQVLWDGLSYNTFNERFQDDVAGMTVNLQIMVPQAINNCITPIAPPPVPPVDCVLSEWSEWSYCTNDLQFRTRTIIQQPEGAGSPCGALIETRACVLEPCNLICEVANLNYFQTFDPELFGSPLGADTIILDTYNGWRPLNEGGNFYTPTTFDSLTWTITGVVRLYPELVLPGDVFPTPFKIEDTSIQSAYSPNVVIGWPTEMPEIGAEFPFTLVYENIPVTNITSGWQAAIIQDDPLIPQAAIEILPGVVIQICQTGVVPPVETLVFDGDYYSTDIDWMGTPLEVIQPYNVVDYTVLANTTSGVSIKVNETGNYRIVFDAILTNKITESFYQSQLALCPTECFIDPPLRWHLMQDIFFPNTPSEVIGFPWTFNEQTNVEIPTTYDFTVALEEAKPYEFTFNTSASPYNGPVISMVSGNIKIYKL